MSKQTCASSSFWDKLGLYNGQKYMFYININNKKYWCFVSNNKKRVLFIYFNIVSFSIFFILM